MPPFHEVGYGSEIVIRCYGRGKTCVCLLSSFVMFRTEYVRYLMVFGVCFS